MLKNLLVVLALFSPLTALAVCTTVDGGVGGAVTVTCTVGNEGAASACPADNAAVGYLLSGSIFSKNTTGITVIAETAGTMAASTLAACVMNPATGHWSPAPDLALSTQALGSQAWVGLSVVAARGRIIWMPVATGLQTVVYIIGAY